MLICCIDNCNSFWPSTLVEWSQIAAYIVSGIGILIAGISYTSNKKLKRAEWLKSLFEKFYENPNYKNARRWLDFNEIEKELSDDTDHLKEEQVSDFLNFFEFIATLEIERQIKKEEIEYLFDYYLNKIKTSTFCTNYIDTFKFRNLKRLLSKVQAK